MGWITKVGFGLGFKGTLDLDLNLDSIIQICFGLGFGFKGCSDLFGEVFGEKGKHARSAVGMGSLPNNMALEIEIIVEIE